MPADAARARRYFRLCASADDPRCQCRLALSLLNQPGRRERDYVQAIAWLRLAANRKYALAATLLERERPRLTAPQSAWADKLMPQLVQPR